MLARRHHETRRSRCRSSSGAICAAAAPRQVGLRPEFGFGAAVGAQRVGVGELAAHIGDRWTPRRITSTPEAMVPPETRPHIERTTKSVPIELARAVFERSAVQRVDGEIRRDGVESTRMHDARAGVLGLLVVQVDALADERRLTGQVGVVGSCGRARRHQRQAVAGVGPDGGDHHLRLRGHRIQGLRRRGVGRQTAARTGPTPPACRGSPAGGRSSGRPARCARRRRPGPGIRLSTCRRSRSRRTGRCRIPRVAVTGATLLRAPPAIRRFPPARARPGTRCTTWYQILACCGASTQWSSDGKYRNRCGLLPSSPAGSAESASSSYHSRSPSPIGTR